MPVVVTIRVFCLQNPVISCDHLPCGSLWHCHDPGPELRIKNTFYEFCIPKDVEPLVRTKTAPSAVNKMGPDPGDFCNI